MLGLTRVWGVLDGSSFAGLPGMSELRKEAERIADAVLRMRQPDGLWSCFLDRPETGIDTSGSAGIAAALAWGARYGLLSSDHLAPARAAHASLATYLTPDGLLTGVAQHNAGGEALQSGGYRVLSQMGMGLLAQLHAALDGPAA
jgi:rhamnogalacturonyl hydrolase YesR